MTEKAHAQIEIYGERKPSYHELRTKVIEDLQRDLVPKDVINDTPLIESSSSSSTTINMRKTT